MSDALPWHWFDFAQSPQAISADISSTIEQGGGERVWKIRAGPLEVPFKFLRRASETPRPVLMMMHGMGLNIATFRAVGPYLLATHDLVLPDYSLLSPVERGGGGWPRGGVPLRELAGIVWAVADALRIERLSLAGNSLGGGLSILAAMGAPERVEKILLSNPACYPQELPRMYRWARVPVLGEFLLMITKPERLIGGVEYIGYVRKERFEAELRSRYLKNMTPRKNRHRLMDLIRHLPGHERDLGAVGALHLPKLGELKTPTLIVWGAQDPLLAAGAGKRLAGDLPGATYAEFPELAHMPHEEAPEIVGPLWADFLNR